MRKFEEACEFAAKAHAGATRKGKDTPYIEHPLMAAEIARELSDNEDVWCAAVLHDTVEDTDTTIEDIKEKFGEYVAFLVAGDSEDKREHMSAADSWKVRKEETIEYAKKASEDEQIIIFADKLANIRELYADYKVLGDKLWERFNQKDPKMHYWYYNSFTAVLDKIKRGALTEEYKEIIDKIFAD